MSLHESRIVLGCGWALLAFAGASLVYAGSETQSQTLRQSPSTTQKMAKQPMPAMKALVPSGVAARFSQKVLKLPVRDCMAAAEHVVENELELRDVRRGQEWIGGHNGQAHGYVYCVRLPGAGACGDASTAIVITSGGSGEAVEGLFQSLYQAIPVKVPIDCP